MKKIGIITHYYNSLNYGGNLQAYALCKYLEKKGCFAEQISYSMNKEDLLAKIKKIVRDILYGRAYREFIKTRKNAFFHFNRELIPHSKQIYNDTNIRKCLDDYDIFITGSDQVWNLNWYRMPYFLDFVPETKDKISYAASMGIDILSAEQKLLFRNSLESYKAVSVREHAMIELLEEVTEKKISLVLDPTLLLSDKDWCEVCDDKIIDEPYIFAYFLGVNGHARELVEKYAKKNNLKLVTIPYAGGVWNKHEKYYGDVQIMDASPQMFLSLIRYAQGIFTDSFHAIIFSIIFKKQFWVFNRDMKGSMNGRIVSLTNMFGLQERFCATGGQESMEYIEKLVDIDYSVDFSEYKLYLDNSYDFITKNILD